MIAPLLAMRVRLSLFQSLNQPSALREHGAHFAYVHRSVAKGTASPDSDLNVAAFFIDPAPVNFMVKLPENVFLLVLNDCALEVPGRVALDGELFLAVDEGAWIDWETRTRKIYLDEKYRIDRSHREFLESPTHGC